MIVVNFAYSVVFVADYRWKSPLKYPESTIKYVLFLTQMLCVSKANAGHFLLFNAKNTYCSPEEFLVIFKLNTAQLQRALTQNPQSGFRTDPIR
ncbi:MAG: hypothetical protein AB3N14_00480 [Flavobacteriaceae bacterium]